MVFIITAILLFVTKDLFGKFYGMNFESKNSGLFLSNTVAMMFGSIVIFIVALAKKNTFVLANVTEFVLAAIFGIAYIFVNFFIVSAMSCGPMGLTGVICGVGGILAGSIYGIICGDNVSSLIIIGSTLITLAVILITPFNKHKHESSSQQIRWFSLSFITFVLNAILCIVKTEAVSNRGADSVLFSLWSFVFASLTGLLIVVFFLHKGDNFKEYLCAKGKSIIFICLSAVIGISCTLANTMQMLGLAAGLPSIIVYPLTTVSTNLLEAFVSVIILKDQKMSVKIYIAYAICIIGIIMVNIG